MRKNNTFFALFALTNGNPVSASNQCKWAFGTAVPYLFPSVVAVVSYLTSQLLLLPAIPAMDIPTTDCDVLYTGTLYHLQY